MANKDWRIDPALSGSILAADYFGQEWHQSDKRKNRNNSAKRNPLV
ncbi:hypothetical protein [Marinobacter sp. SS5-14b]|nr:hypothetical protein [Marinobacter sp. SS5-14b]